MYSVLCFCAPGCSRHDLNDIRHFDRFLCSPCVISSSPRPQVELKLAEYHKLARKLKLIPMTAENACGYDFEMRPFECSAMVQYKTQIQVLHVADLKKERKRQVSLVDSKILQQGLNRILYRWDQVQLIVATLRFL